ncbi:hypothetical protein AC578_2012 [Pseudocercospora eumusae]|uniref:Mid2 domain-containing protein n=1 Tax=Pseudocercospora eumusae TaxID=321146 RepID=A0A139HH70_9PEZI|nr:hypothetical protein AC578_2012 [Pseudocercospora eumusae]
MRSSCWLPLTLSFLLTLQLVNAKHSLRITYPTTPQKYRLFGKPTFFFDSTWPNITLELWQGPDDKGRMDMEYLLRGVSSSIYTNYTWTPRLINQNLYFHFHTDSGQCTLTNFSTRHVPFHLFLYATNKYPNCTECSSNSSDFRIVTEGDQEAGQREALKIGLGVGLGVGIPLVAGLAGFATWFFMRCRRRHDDSSSQSTPLRPPYDGWTRSPGTAPSAPVYLNGIDHKTMTLEPGGGHLNEFPQNHTFAPVEAPHDRERQELPGTEVGMDVAKGR